PLCVGSVSTNCCRTVTMTRYTGEYNPPSSTTSQTFPICFPPLGWLYHSAWNGVKADLSLAVALPSLRRASSGPPHISLTCLRVPPYSILLLTGSKERETMTYRMIISGLVLTLAVAGSAPLVQAKKNCEDLLDNNAYRCEITTQEGDVFHDCFVFNSAD